MLCSLPGDRLSEYVVRQLAHFFPDDHDLDANGFRAAVSAALTRTERCFSEIQLKYYRKDGTLFFNHLQSDQYAMFLYILSNQLWRTNPEDPLASKVYCLNKVLHSVDVLYDVVLPEVFVFFHPVGSVVGRATYGNYLVIYQNVTIGSNRGIFPSIGEGVALYTGATVVGSTTIGDNCQIAAHSVVVGDTIPDDSVVSGQSPNLDVRPLKHNVIEDHFLGKWNAKIL
ncbi:MAG: serine acetyltransferase [Myxococcota bacterium]|nr:serine acetyltransferase [Myxococcota bacterium]